MSLVSSRLVSLALFKKYKTGTTTTTTTTNLPIVRAESSASSSSSGSYYSSSQKSGWSSSTIRCEKITNAIDVFTFEADNKDKRRNKDVIVIFAWFGSDKKHVRKYAQMYENRRMGEKVIVVAPPALASLSPNMTTQIANDFLTGFFEEEAIEGVHVHSFSNGGFLFAGNLFHHASDVKKREDDCSVNAQLAKKFKMKIKSVTLDCAPAKLSAEVISRAFASVLLGSRVEDIYDNNTSKEGESSIIGGLMKSALDNLANTLLSDENLQRKINNAYAAWETALDVNVPLKMLFSESDKLVPVNEVQEFAQRQRDRGNAAVYTKSWKNVPHCEIGRWHQDEYVRALFEEK
jgi:hypothetical protein